MLGRMLLSLAAESFRTRAVPTARQLLRKRPGRRRGRGRRSAAGRPAGETYLLAEVYGSF